MITYMQFIDKGTSLSISELTDENTVDIIMEELENDMYGINKISLTEIELVRLRDWVNESINALNGIKSEAP